MSTDNPLSIIYNEHSEAYFEIMERESLRNGNLILNRPITDIYLIRHAECEMNLLDIVGGRSNHSPLTPTGIEQAKALKYRLKKLDLRRPLYRSSPAIRTISTLLYSVDKIPCFEVDTRLQELDQGDWTGRLKKEVYTPENLAIIDKDRWNFRPPGGESQADAAKRMRIFLSQNMKPTYSKVVFTHGGSIKYLCAELFDWKKQNVWKVLVDYCSITHLRYDGQWHLIKFND